MGAWGWDRGDGSMGTGSVRMVAYFWYSVFRQLVNFFVDQMISLLKHGEGRIISGTLFSDNFCFFVFDQMISFLICFRYFFQGERLLSLFQNSNHFEFLLTIY